MLRYELGVLEEFGRVGGLGGAEAKTGLKVVAGQQDRLVRDLSSLNLTALSSRSLRIAVLRWAPDS